MAVTKQIYTATATWTAATLASTFRSALIDAGIMTEWFDSFTNTVENRILEVTYDGAKTYGKTYYWFMFTTSGIFVQTALGWNATTHVPTGSQYLDYFSTTTSATTNHRTMVTLAAATTVTITRYTSAIDTDCSWFLIRNGSTNLAFMIPSAGFGPQPFIDLSKIAFNGMIHASVATSNNATYIDFIHSACHTRRTHLGAAALRGSTTLANYTSTMSTFRHGLYGNASGAHTNNILTTPALFLPIAMSNTNTALGSDHLPVFTGPPMSIYLPSFPTDFAVAPYYAANTMAVQDTFVVSSGVEEYEVLLPALNATSTDTAKLLLLARTV